MHHSKNICKKNYINNDMLNLYINNNKQFKQLFKSNTKSDISEEFINFLEKIYKLD